MFWSPNFQIKTFPVQSIALTLTFTVNTIQGQFWPFGTVCGLFWDQSNVKQAGAELGQAKPGMGCGENDLARVATFGVEVEWLGG